MHKITTRHSLLAQMNSAVPTDTFSRPGREVRCGLARTKTRCAKRAHQKSRFRMPCVHPDYPTHPETRPTTRKVHSVQKRLLNIKALVCKGINCRRIEQSFFPSRCAELHIRLSTFPHNLCSLESSALRLPPPPHSHCSSR